MGSGNAIFKYEGFIATTASMYRKITCSYFIIIIIILSVNSVALFSYGKNTFAFEPTPFNKIPLVIVNSEDDEHVFGADYSIDFGGETVIEHDDDAQLASNMQLDKDDSSLSLEVQCDGNDICDTSLSPESIRIYLVDRNVKDGHIARNSIPLLELEDHDCGSQSLEDCANFDFSMPDDILTQRYKIVVHMNFDEAEWIFINPIRITN
jgi:hypothetical protein